METFKCRYCKNSKQMKLYYQDIKGRPTPYKSEKVYIGYCPITDDYVTEEDYCKQYEKGEITNDIM